MSDRLEDLRVRRTHKLLWEALMAELALRPFEEITVREICERAMVHRSTFYKHYVDKYALLEQGIRQMYDELIAGEEHRPPNTFSLDQPPTYFVRLFEHAAEHQAFYKLMLCGKGGGRFHQLVKAYLTDVLGERAHSLTSTTANHTQAIQMHAHFVAGAVLSLLAWWLEHDMPLTPHQMAQYLLSSHGILPSHLS